MSEVFYFSPVAESQSKLVGEIRNIKKFKAQSIWGSHWLHWFQSLFYKMLRSSIPGTSHTREIFKLISGKKVGLSSVQASPDNLPAVLRTVSTLENN